MFFSFFFPTFHVRVHVAPFFSFFFFFFFFSSPTCEEERGEERERERERIAVTGCAYLCIETTIIRGK